MTEQVTFFEGIYFKEPSEKAPDFVLGKLSIKREELIAWLQSQEGVWINGEVVRSKKTGKPYIKVDNWEPTKDQQYAEGMQQARTAAQNPAAQQDNFDDDIPF